MRRKTRLICFDFDCRVEEKRQKLQTEMDEEDNLDWTLREREKLGVDKKGKRKACVTAKYIPGVEAEGDCNSASSMERSGEGEKLVHE
ncbi:uncharacterized protein HKW66_Vig0159930 [Vigna angularis]|uniref:Uncharacterized protein n=1 Tax=Phaseolus angularis TaxID=3914 RepID=A0A8T0JLQ3_PHAAN|nr:uncharacterized protein HKW66_Vig0159930 [Vigna angularis]